MINSQTPQKVFIDQQPQERNTEVKAWVEYRQLWVENKH